MAFKKVPRIAAVLIPLLATSVASANSYTTVIGGAAAYSPGGWGSFAVVEHGTIGVDVTSSNPIIRVDFTIDVSSIACKLLTGTGCNVTRLEQIRIDGEGPSSSSKSLFFEHTDQYDLAGLNDTRHRDTYDGYYCSNMALAPTTIRSPGVGEIKTGSCVVSLSPGHHTIELYVDTGLLGGFGTAPQPFSETIEVTVSQATGMPAFAASALIPTGASATGIAPLAAVADFNGDGFPDLATANLVDSSISVLLGNGKGGFAAPVRYAAGNGPYGIGAGDFNGDGKPDLAVVNGLDNTVSILLNDGSGGFPAKPTYTYAVGSQPYGVSVSDLNRDGALDLIVTNNASNSVSVLRGKGDGSFQAAATYGAGNLPFGAAVTDLNRDGYPDLIVWNYADNTVGGYLSDMTGKFAAPVAYAIGSAPYSVSAGDFNGDGYPDLAVTNLGDNTISVLLNDTTGKFSRPVTYATGVLPASVLAADLNGDGLLDLIVANLGNGTVGLLLGKGDGTFLPQTTYLAGDQPYSLLAADFNGDGKIDLAVTSFYDNTIGVLLQTTVGTTSGHMKGVPKITQNPMSLHSGDALRGIKAR